MDNFEFKGCFFLKPVFISAMILLVVNNLWFKPSLRCPVIAGKISDIAIIIFLPALICLAVETMRYISHSIIIWRKKNSTLFRDETYFPSHPLVLGSILISALAMSLLQLSGDISDTYYRLISFFNQILFNGRTIAAPTRDLTDLISLSFLIIPYITLKNAP